jgi:hypothetical protein
MLVYPILIFVLWPLLNTCVACLPLEMWGCIALKENSLREGYREDIGREEMMRMNVDEAEHPESSRDVERRLRRAVDAKRDGKWKGWMWVHQDQLCQTCKRLAPN